MSVDAGGGSSSSLAVRLPLDQTARWTDAWDTVLPGGTSLLPAGWGSAQETRSRRMHDHRHRHLRVTLRAVRVSGRGEALSGE